MIGEPALDSTGARRADRRPERGPHGLHEEDVEVWDSRGVLVAQSRQVALLL